MTFNVITEETNLYEKVWVSFLKDLDNACEKFILEYAEKHDLSFKCAEKFLMKYYNITIGVDITDNKCYCTFVSKLKPIEQILEEDIDLNTVCRKELWGSDCELFE